MESAICKQRKWLEFNNVWFCKSCEYNIIKQRHHIEKKIFGQYRFFLQGYSMPTEKGEKCFSLISLHYKTLEEMVEENTKFQG